MQLSDAQLRKIADICADVGQVSLASLVIPFLITPTEPALIAAAVVATLVSWAASVVLLRER